MRIGFFMNYCSGGVFADLVILRALFKTQIELLPPMMEKYIQLTWLKEPVYLVVLPNLLG
jgi:hypothetical protein